jgi:hypothetical protein
VFSESKKRTEAIVAYGWETKAFYAKWMGGAADRDTLVELQGPVLNLGSPQSPLAPAILRLTEEVLLKLDVQVFRQRIQLTQWNKGFSACLKSIDHRGIRVSDSDFEKLEHRVLLDVQVFC